MILNTPIHFVGTQNENVKIHSDQTAYISLYNDWISYFHRQCFYKPYQEVRLSKQFWRTFPFCIFRALC